MDGSNNAMLVDGYAGWIGLAVLLLAVAGGIWGSRRKK